MTAPCILLIDDHAMFRAGLELVIKSAIPNAQIFGASSLDEAMSIDAPTMNVVLLDIQLNGLNGIECVAPIKQKWNAVPILMLSSHTAPETMRLALSRGATAFVSKAETADRITDAIRQVLLGNMNAPLPDLIATSQRRLTPRQCEVIDLMHQGLSNKLIARKLDLSDNTVRRHVQDILEFFNVGSRAEAVFAAQRRGLVD